MKIAIQSDGHTISQHHQCFGEIYESKLPGPTPFTHKTRGKPSGGGVAPLSIEIVELEIIFGDPRVVFGKPDRCTVMDERAHINITVAISPHFGSIGFVGYMHWVSWSLSRSYDLKAKPGTVYKK